MGTGALIFVIKITILIAFIIKSWAKAQPLQYDFTGGAVEKQLEIPTRKFAVRR